jgi:hypothetical protein
LRQLRKSPGFTITATAMLAVAICANSTVFGWIDGTMLRPIPGARDTGDLVSMQRGERNFSPTPPFSYLDYRDLREQNHTQNTTVQMQYQLNRKWSVSGARDWNGGFGIDARYHKDF